ncbi:MAG: hypothetical protein BRC29_00235 [Nanohaloarchaea archaeon SW_7_43_1]|nr:MAG: hypothetical protein BRC29_00235 [Nanohaloarchaea archaeon SW_7_43_1]
MNDSLDREGKKIAILAKLGRKTKIGMDYIPKEKAYSRIPGHARGELEGILDEMHKDGLIEYHKGKNCISINPNSISEVVDLIEDEVPSYVINMLD